jgi:hypothetical protein
LAALSVLAKRLEHTRTTALVDPPRSLITETCLLDGGPHAHLSGVMFLSHDAHGPPMLELGSWWY